ncbi:MAG: ATP-binding protein [Haloferacaceae archaeon]
MVDSRQPDPAAFDAIEALVLVADGEDRLTGWNASVERAVGRGDLRGRPLPDLVVADDAPKVHEAAETARWTGSGETVADVPTDDGRRVPHEFRFRRLPGADDGGGVVGIGRDVTVRERRRERIAVLTRLLRHDARNRLTAIRGYVTEALDALDAEDGPDPAAATEHLASAATAAESLSDAVDRMYAIQRDIADADTDPVPVRQVIDRVVAALEDDHPDATVATRVDPPSVRAAAGRALGVALEELVANALAHAGEDPRVVIAATATDDRIHIRVSDDGPGIPATDLQSIRTGIVTPLGHASGTGLWVARWAVRSFGGTIEFEVDDGTTVTVVAPRADPDG